MLMGAVQQARRSCQFAVALDLLPCREFARPDLVAGEVPFMKAKKLCFRHVPEPLTVRFMEERQKALRRREWP